MNFLKVIEQVVGGLEQAGVRYALIGGFAMGLRGVQRATMDLDFILLLEDVATADTLLRRLGYERIFHSENVSHYESKDGEWGRIDLLHAFRRPSLGMLDRAEVVALPGGARLRVVQLEDLVGLKVQALVNNPSRAVRDWLDIHLLLEAAGRDARPIDWELVRDYLRIFRLETRLDELKTIHAEAKRS